MVHTVSLLLLVVAAASAASELDLQFIICETHTKGNTEVGKSIKLPPYNMPPEQRSITIPVPQIWSSGCIASGVKAEVCHARVNYFNTNLDTKTLEVSRLPIITPRDYEVTITITSYCDRYIQPQTKVLPKLWE